MAVFTFIILFVPLSLAVAIGVVDRRDRAFVLKLVALAWIFHVPMVLFINSWLPFAGGGDDVTYFLLADTPIVSVEDIFDLGKFSNSMEQPGYPWLLHILSAIAGHDLIALKLLNLFFLIVMALTWYKIGVLLESRDFARKIATLVVCLTPLWYYVHFLLKDLAIAALQSIFLLLVIQVWSRIKIGSVFGLAFVGLGLLLLRVPLIIQSASVLLGALAVKSLSFNFQRNSTIALLAVTSIFIASIPSIMSPDFMFRFGISAEARVIGSEAFVRQLQFLLSNSEINPIVFPVIYLFSDIGAISPEGWQQLDSTWLRGLLAIPWILFLVPFFLFGTFQLFRLPDEMRSPRGPLAHIRQCRILSTAWGAVFLFVLSSFFVSWVVGDSTRWRVPDMPMVAAIALLGWQHTSRDHRQETIVVWFCAIGALFSAFYFLGS